jgi:hypothetical protein
VHGKRPRIHLALFTDLMRDQAITDTRLSGLQILGIDRERVREVLSGAVSSSTATDLRERCVYASSHLQTEKRLPTISWAS